MRCEHYEHGLKDYPSEAFNRQKLSTLNIDNREKITEVTIESELSEKLPFKQKAKG